MRISCKKCRRLGESLCGRGNKCTFVKKPYPPGIRDSDRKHRTNISEFGTQLKEKQKVRTTYGLRERQFENYVKKASLKGVANPPEKLFENLESRLDSVAYRMGFATSRSLARQIVGHGHLTVNGRRVTIPSYKISVGDIVEVRDGSKSKAIFNELSDKMEKVSTPLWIVIDTMKLSGKVQSVPKLSENELVFNLASVIEFYSR